MYDVVIPGARVVAARFTLIEGLSVQTNEFGTVVGTAGLGYLVRFDRDGARAGVFPNELVVLSSPRAGGAN